MKNETILGIDLGGTNIRAGLVCDNNLSPVIAKKVNSKGSVEEVLQEVYDVIDKLFDPQLKAIGIGIPGLVDVEKGIVFDVVNIPSWKSVPLKQLVEERYKIPVCINNDANCFALGEFHFGKGKGYGSMLGVTIGTGLGTGIIINKKLFSGKNCGAGEIGMAGYLDKTFEYYGSGQFFENVYGINGEQVFKDANEGNLEAIKMYEEMGNHLGNAIKMMMYAYDPEIIILGGTVSNAWEYFNKAMWQSIKTFPYKTAADNLKIQISTLQNSSIFGAAALYYDTTI